MRLFLLLLFVSLFHFQASADSGTYTSQNNATGNWETSSMWAKNYSWMSNPPPSASVSFGIELYGYVTRNGDLTISGGDAVMNIYDTLIIKGNLFLSSLGGTPAITVHSGGILIILGDFNGGNTGGTLVQVQSGGNMIITGNYNQQQGAVNISGNLYSFDPTPTFNWGASVNGISYGYTSYPADNTALLGSNMKTESQLSTNNTPLYDFLHSLTGTLPIVLVDFRAKSDDKIVLLTWVTGEGSIDKFIIQHSVNGLDFNTIGVEIYQAPAPSKTEASYSFEDTAPVIGTNYYRLIMADVDGSVEYSKIVKAEFKSDRSIIVSPNPSNGHDVHINLNFVPDEYSTAEVIDQLGVSHGIFPVASTSTAVPNLQEVPRGVYFLKFTSGDYRRVVRMVVTD